MSEPSLAFEFDGQDFERYVSGYGAVIYNGTAEQRLRAMKEHTDGPHMVVDGREIKSYDEFRATLRNQVQNIPREDIDVFSFSLNRIRDIMNQDYGCLIIQEFDSMPLDVQTSVAQLLKGFVETGYEGGLGYTCSESDSVVIANGDLRMRVRSWELT